MEKETDLLSKELEEKEQIIPENEAKQFWTRTIRTETGMLVLVVLLLVVALVVIFFQSNLPEKQERVLTGQPIPTQSAAVGKVDEYKKEINQQKAVFSEVNTGQKIVISKGMIAWQTPADVGDLGLTTKDLYDGTSSDSVISLGVKYVLSGKILTGKYEGGELYVVAARISEGLIGSSPNIFRFVKHKQKIIFLGHNLADDFERDVLKNYFNFGNFEREINDDIFIEELEYPETVYIGSDREKLVKNKYDEAFFDNQELREVARHNQYGKVWTTDERKIEQEPLFELNSYFVIEQGGVKKKIYQEAFRDYGFYLQSPDGLAISYRLVPDIFKDDQGDGRYLILDARWNDGTANSEKYELAPSGCGTSKYAYNETAGINKEKNLIKIGTTSKGDILYGYKDASQPGFSELYEEIYWPGDGKQKKSKEDFLKIYPKIFWEDPFGRLLAFYRADIINPAECGKPVIYLYPEEKTDVEVRVLPGKGISISDPAYNNGWKVSADPKGLLYNYVDGKKYPYLFWEGQGDVPYKTPEAGFVVKREQLEGFFNDKLAQLGMIEPEIKDFKEFWLPEMRKENKPYYFVTFLGKSFIDRLAPLEIEPKPDTVIRVLMDYYGLEEYKEVPGFSIKTPQRKGFVVVEWGGMLNR